MSTNVNIGDVVKAVVDGHDVVGRVTEVALPLVTVEVTICLARPAMRGKAITVDLNKVPVEVLAASKTGSAGRKNGGEKMKNKPVAVATEAPKQAAEADKAAELIETLKSISPAAYEAALAALRAQKEDIASIVAKSHVGNGLFKFTNGLKIANEAISVTSVRFTPAQRGDLNTIGWVSFAMLIAPGLGFKVNNFKLVRSIQDPDEIGLLEPKDWKEERPGYKKFEFVGSSSIMEELRDIAVACFRAAAR